MRYSGWARVDFFGDPATASQYVPTARLLIGQIVNRVELGGIQQASTRWEHPDGTLIEAGFDGTTPWARIYPTTTTSSTTQGGYGFILSPFNGSEPTAIVPIYASTLLLINGGAYAHDYPDDAHHWFTSPDSGDYFALGNEWVNNPLLQGNLHWRSASDQTFHVSWLGNPSDPIPYFKIDFQDGIIDGSFPYRVRLSNTTAFPPRTGTLFNYDTRQVFSEWLSDSFGGLHNLQNGTGVGQVVCYKGHVVKPIYDAFAPGSPIVTRSTIVGVGGSTDPKTLKRTLFLVVRAFIDQDPPATIPISESVYSFDIDNATAIPVLLASRNITSSGTYTTPISVDPIPLHGYYWDETNTKFVCLAVKVTTQPTNDTSSLPTLQQHSLFADTGKATWQVTGGTAAAFTFDNSVSVNRSMTSLPTWSYTSDVTEIFNSDLEANTVTDEVDVESFTYGVNNAVIAITDKNVVTTNAITHNSDTTTIHNSGPYSGTNGFQHQSSNTAHSSTWSQNVSIGAKTWDVAEFTTTANNTTTIDYDATFSEISGTTNDATTMSYTGKVFLWFNDADQVYAYFEFQLGWNYSLVNTYGPIPIAGFPPTPTETFNLTVYQGRYVVESPEGSHATDFFDLTAGGQIGNAPGHSNFYAFMPKFPIRIGPGSGNDGSYTVVANTSVTSGATTTIHQMYQKTYTTLPLFEIANLVNFSMWNVPSWSVSASFHTGVGGRGMEPSEPDSSYSFQATHPGGWAINGKRLCFSQIGPRVNDASGNAITQSPFQYLTKGDLDTLTGATGDDRGHYPLCYIAKREIKATGE